MLADMLNAASNLSERLPGKVQTNNRAEMYASRRRFVFSHGLAQPDPSHSLKLTHRGLAGCRADTGI